MTGYAKDNLAPLTLSSEAQKGLALKTNPHRNMPSYFRNISLVVLALSISVSSALCQERESEPIRIGALLALTSDQAAPNRAFLEGIQIALGEINQKPVWKNQKIELLVEDGQLLPQQSFAGVTKLITFDKVVALITGSAVESKAGASLINRAKVPSVTLWDASPDIEALGAYIFSIGLWTPSSAEVAADFSVSQLSKRKAFIFNSEDEWSFELEKAYRRRAIELGVEVVGTTTFRPGETEFRTSIAKAQRSGAEVLYVTVGYNIPAFFKQLRQSNWEIPIVTSDILSESLIGESPELYEGAYQTQIFTPTAARTAHMLKLYEQTFRKSCDWTPWVAWGYDGLHLLARAISKVGPDGEKIAEHLTRVKDYAGASGNITMVGRSAPRRPSLFQVQRGEFRILR